MLVLHPSLCDIPIHTPTYIGSMPSIVLFLIITSVALLLTCHSVFVVYWCVLLLFKLGCYIALTLLCMVLHIILFQAVSLYSKAQNLRPGDPIILGNRSLAFCR
jgi:hypothetical protein